MTSDTPGDLFSPLASAARTAEVREIDWHGHALEVQIQGHLTDEYEVFDVRRGGHSEVYLCLAKSLPGLPVALKSFPKSVTYNLERRRAFLRECLLSVEAGSLPGFLGPSSIVPVGGQPFLVMPAVLPSVDGHVNLRDAIGSQTLTSDRITFLAWSLADSMAFAADQITGLIHGDLKPENILLLGDVPHIADLGLARATRDLDESHYPMTTVNYAAPELDDRTVAFSSASDVYAFGRILDELLSAQLRDPQISNDEPRERAILRLSLECTSPSPDDRPPFRKIADELWPFVSQCASTERLVMTRTLLALHKASFDQMSPHAVIDSFVKLRQWVMAIELIDSQPIETRDAAIHAMHGLALTRLVRDEEALSEYEIALSLSDPGSIQAWGIRLEMSTVLANMGRFKSAEAAARDLVREAPSDGHSRQALIPLAQALFGQGNFDEAENALHAVLQREDRVDIRCEALVLDARVQLEFGRVPRAIERIQTAITLNPTRDRYHSILGHILLENTTMIGWASQAFSNALLSGSADDEDLILWTTCQLISTEPTEWIDVRAQAATQFGSMFTEDIWNTALGMVADWLDKGSTVESRDHEEPSNHKDNGMAPRELDPPTERDFDNIRVSSNDVGYYTFDLYGQLDHEGFLEDVVSAYRELTHLLPSQVMRGSPVLVLRCSHCGRGIATNRTAGHLLPCRYCNQLNRIDSVTDPIASELASRLEVALDLVSEPVDGCACVVVAQPSTTLSAEQELEVRRLAERIGLTPLAEDHSGVVMAFITGVLKRLFSWELRPYGALYEFPPGSRHASRLTPPPVEEYLIELRRMLRVPLSSTSARFDANDGSMESLLYGDKLEELQDIVMKSADLGLKRYLMVITQLWLFRSEIESAVLCGNLAVRAFPDDVDAWVARGMALLAGGDSNAAIEIVDKTLAMEPGHPAAHGLAVAIEASAGQGGLDSVALAKAISVGGIRMLSND